MRDPEFVGPTLDIPPCLIIDAETRRKNWEGRPYTDPYRGGNAGEWAERQRLERETRARIEVERKEKRDASRITFLSRMEREGKVYDRKAKMWLPRGDGAPKGAGG